MMVCCSTAILPAIIGKDSRYLDSLLPIKGQYIVMQNQCRLIGQFAGMQIHPFPEKAAFQEGGFKTGKNPDCPEEDFRP